MVYLQLVNVDAFEVVDTKQSQFRSPRQTRSGSEHAISPTERAWFAGHSNSIGDHTRIIQAGQQPCPDQGHATARNCAERTQFHFSVNGVSAIG
jgi:hypothetical protein